MPDPITTLTASTKAMHREYASLAFQEFIKSGAGEWQRSSLGKP